MNVALLVENDEIGLLCKVSRKPIIIILNFLLFLLRIISFGERWQRWMSACISLVRFLEWVNGSVRFFKSSRNPKSRWFFIYPLTYSSFFGSPLMVWLAGWRIGICLDCFEENKCFGGEFCLSLKYVDNMVVSCALTQNPTRKDIYLSLIICWWPANFYGVNQSQLRILRCILLGF